MVGGSPINKTCVLVMVIIGRYDMQFDFLVNGKSQAQAGNPRRLFRDAGSGEQALQIIISGIAEPGNSQRQIIDSPRYLAMKISLNS